MLRRDLRDVYNSCSPDLASKDRILDSILEQRPKDGEMKGRNWKPKGQAVAWLVIVLALLIVLSAAVYGAYRCGVFSYVEEMFATEPTEAQRTEPDSTPTTLPTEPVSTEPTQLSYQPLAAKYIQAIQEEWDMIRCQEEDISYLVMFLNNPEDLYCSIVDLDGNGITELIITDGNVILDLYTCANAEYVHLLSGAERNSYRLTADNMILNTGSGGAGNTVFQVYLYYGENLIPVEMIVCDASKDAQNPWFRGIDNLEDVKPITEQEAREIIGMYPSVPISGTVITACD